MTIDFPNKGKFRVYDKSWNHVGYADEAQYRGQLPITYPEDWTPLECFAGSRLAQPEPHAWDDLFSELGDDVRRA